MQARFYYVLSANPLILGSTGAIPKDGLIQRPTLPERVRRYSLLQHFSWVIGNGQVMQGVADAQMGGKDRGIDYHAMVSSIAEDHLRLESGVTGAHIGHNIHVNEQIFMPMRERRDYDAIYVARLVSRKRHELAQDIKRLRLVAYGHNPGDLPSSLKHASCNRKSLNAYEVAKAINSAHAGLCLSAEEGQMNASIEYLACGIPVVTTPSRGGREEYFDELNSLTVADFPFLLSTMNVISLNEPSDICAVVPAVLCANWKLFGVA